MRSGVGVTDEIRSIKNTQQHTCQCHFKSIEVILYWCSFKLSQLHSTRASYKSGNASICKMAMKVQLRNAQMLQKRAIQMRHQDGYAFRRTGKNRFTRIDMENQRCQFRKHNPICMSRVIYIEHIRIQEQVSTYI